MEKYSHDCKTSWKTGSTESEKSWGYEIRVGTLSTVSAKVLCIKKGHHTSLKYYPHKNEVLFLRKGNVKVIHGAEHTLKNETLYPYQSTSLSPGDGVCIQSGCPYQIFAEENSEIFELGDASRTPAVRISRELYVIPNELETK